MSAGPWQNYVAPPAAEQGPWIKYGANAATASAPPEATISAAKQPSGMLGNVEQWASNVADDIKNGTDKTGVGSVLKKMGAHGVYNGNPQAVGDFMASLPLGLAKMTQGAAQVPQGKIAQGAGNIVSGAAQAATIPSGFIAPEIPKAPEAALAAGGVLNKVPIVGRAFASTTRAGRTFQEVNQAIGNQPFKVTPDLMQAAQAVQREASLGGGGVPNVVSKFMQRITPTKSPIPGYEMQQAPLTFADARRFASNASRMTASEWMDTISNGNMRRLLGAFHGSFNDAVQQAAEAGGQGGTFAQAMGEFRQAKQNLRALQTAAGAAAIKYGYGKAHELGALLLGGQ